MGKTGNWRAAENKLAGNFGTQRRDRSGANPYGPGDDGMHQSLYLEAKYGKQIPPFVRNVILETTEKAKAEGKGRIPVVGLHPKGDKTGMYYLVHAKHLYAFCEAYLAARDLRIIGNDDVQSKITETLNQLGESTLEDFRGAIATLSLILESLSSPQNAHHEENPNHVQKSKAPKPVRSSR